MYSRKTAAFASAIALGLGVGACGGEEEEPADAPVVEQQEQQQEQEQSGNAGAEATPTPMAAIDNLDGETTAVKLDPGFLSALESLNVTPGPVGDAEITEQGSAVFPITGGNVEYYDPNGEVKPFVQGELQHEGSGLSLEAGGKKVELTDFVIDPGESVLTGKVSVDGEVAAESAPLFFLDGRTLEPLEVKEDKNVAILEGTTVKLRQEAADLLNETFGIQDLKKDMEIGVAKLTLALN